MKQKHRIVLSAALVLTACNSSSDTSRMTETSFEETAARPLAQEKARPVTETAVDTSVHVPELARGTHEVFGLKMPRGMIPLPHPQKGVYRFEGTHSMGAVRPFLERQFDVPVEVKEDPDNGIVVFKNALVKDGHRHLGTRQRLFVKLFEGSLGGAGVEVWQRKVIRSDPGGHHVGRGAARLAPSHRNKDASRTSSVPRTPLDRERQFYSVVDKLSQGKSLTQDERRSYYFTEEK